MSRGATVTHSSLETLLLLQRAATVVLSGHNALYFAMYRSRHGRRRLGAFVLMFINLAIGAESLAFGVLPWTASGSTGLVLGSRLIATTLSLAVAVAMAVLIFRQHIRRK